jgi:E3 ubiquitin-protein ligase RBX1
MPIINIEKINLFAEWNFDVINEYCGICKNHIMENSLCLENNKKLNAIAVGECNHCFHYNCINLWIKNKEICPLCNSKWKFRVENLQS